MGVVVWRFGRLADASAGFEPVADSGADRLLCKQPFLACLTGSMHSSHLSHRGRAFWGMTRVARRVQRPCKTCTSKLYHSCAHQQHSASCKECSGNEPEQLEMWGSGFGSRHFADGFVVARVQLRFFPVTKLNRCDRILAMGCFS